MKAISTPNAPAAISSYSQGRVHGNLLFVSGQLPIDPATGKLIEGDAATQLGQCLRNVAAIAEAAGASLNNALRVAVMVTDLGEFGSINAAYQTFFTAPFPCRATFQVAALPMGAKVEVEATIGLAS